MPAKIAGIMIRYAFIKSPGKGQCPLFNRPDQEFRIVFHRPRLLRFQPELSVIDRILIPQHLEPMGTGGNHPVASGAFKDFVILHDNFFEDTVFPQTLRRVTAARLLFAQRTEINPNIIRF